MADRLPLKLADLGGGVGALKEFEAGDTIPQAQVLGAYNLGVGSFAKNALINGDFKVWQRGTSVSAPPNSSSYGADRWFVFATGATHTIVKSVQGTQASLAVTGAAGSASVAILQRIEGLNTQSLAGKICTLSVDLLAADARTFSLTAYSNAGANDFNTETLIATINVTVAPNVAKRGVITFAAPSNAGNGMTVSISQGGLPAGVSMSIANAQLEVGAVATPLEYRSYSQELALCQRYYFVAKDNFALCGNTLGSTCDFPFPVEMRATPTVTHGYLDSNFVAVSSPAANQWAAQLAGASVVSKVSGTIAVGFVVSSRKNAVLYITGAVWNQAPNWLLTNYDLALAPRFSAEL
ncbi:MAG: hypothetical protein K2X80_07790 [Pseudomonadaceae bacterium]|nr:hypothetical protein [Pseudomonadaceae bacterium]